MLNKLVQVDECGFTIPRTLARMASERSVNIVFGPKRGQWRIDADLAGETRIKQRLANGKGRASSSLAQNKGQQQQRAASMRVLSMLQTEQSIRSVTSSVSQNQEPNNAPGPSVEPPLDIARLALPICGSGKEELRHELAKLQPIDDSVASDQVSTWDHSHSTKVRCIVCIITSSMRKKRFTSKTA